MSKKQLSKKEERKKRVDDLFNELEEGFTEEKIKLLNAKDTNKNDLVSKNIHEIIDLTEKSSRKYSSLNFLDPEQATDFQHDIWLKKLKYYIQKWSSLKSRVRDKKFVNRHIFFHSFEFKYLKNLNKESNIAIYRLVNASLHFLFDLIESNTPVPHIYFKKINNKKLEKLGVFKIEKVSDGHAINVVIENKLINKINDLAKSTGTNKSIVVNWAINSIISLIYDKKDFKENL